MLYWVLVFLVVAIIAGALAFGAAAASSGIAQILFFILLAFLAVSIATRFIRRVG